MIFFRCHPSGIRERLLIHLPPSPCHARLGRNAPSHIRVTQAWGDIYRYVANTAWGQAADLKGLASNNNYPLYQKPEHAFPGKKSSPGPLQGALSDSDRKEKLPMSPHKSSESNSNNTTRQTPSNSPVRASTKDISQQPGSPDFRAGSQSAEQRKKTYLGLMSPTCMFRCLLSSRHLSSNSHILPYVAVLRSPVDGVPTTLAFRSSGPSLKCNEGSPEYEVLSKMRIKWSTVHAQFSKFNGRPNARGGECDRS